MSTWCRWWRRQKSIERSKQKDETRSSRLTQLNELKIEIFNSIATMLNTISFQTGCRDIKKWKLLGSDLHVLSKYEKEWKPSCRTTQGCIAGCVRGQEEELKYKFTSKTLLRIGKEKRNIENVRIIRKLCKSFNFWERSERIKTWHCKIQILADAWFRFIACVWGMFSQSAESGEWRENIESIHKIYHW